jgi:hypothetical protein
MLGLGHKLLGGFMTGTNQIYARQRHFGQPRYNSVVKADKADHTDPELGNRLEKVLSEKLNARTKEFVSSLKDFYEQRGYLTAGQMTPFEKIESRFSPGEKAKLEKWEQEFRTQHLANAKILAQYYWKTGYWTTVASHILEDPDYVPPAFKWNKMSTNKYAQQVLRNVHDEPKFLRGTMVQLRSNVGKSQGTHYLQELRNRLAFVIEYDDANVGSSKGGKGYKILPMGYSTPISVLERDLMKPNKRGVSAQ